MSDSSYYLAMLYDGGTGNYGILASDRPYICFIHPAGFQYFYHLGMRQDFQYIFAYYLLFFHLQNIQKGLVHYRNITFFINNYIGHMRTFYQTLQNSGEFLLRFLQFFHKNLGPGHVQKEAAGNSPDYFPVLNNRHPGYYGVPSLYCPNVRLVHTTSSQNLRQP